MKKFNLKTFAVIAIVLIGASVVYANYASSKANEGITLTPHIKGDANSKVTLTEYSDFQCPACGQFFPIVQSVLEKYGDQIKFEYKHFPLISIHPFAVPAAKASEAAGQQGKFFEMHDKLFENQQVWSNAGNPQAYFYQYAEELGLDVDLFKKHMGASLIQDKIETEFREAQSLGLTGTPSFLLNGERMRYETYADFVSAIESALGISATSSETTGSDSVVEFGI